MALVHAQAEFSLEQWGIWCRTAAPGPKRAISWMGPMMDRLVGSIVSGDDRPVRAWEDSVCEAFDSHVVRHVRENNKDAYDALKAYYAYPDGDDYRAVSKSVLARRLKVSRDTAVKRLEIGINMVAAMLAVAA